VIIKPSLELVDEHQSSLSGKSNSEIKLGDKFQLVKTLEDCDLSSSLELKTIDGKILDITTNEIHNIALSGTVVSAKCSVSFSFKVTPLQIAFFEALLFVIYQAISAILGMWPFYKAILADDPLYLSNLSETALIINLMVDYIVSSLNYNLSIKVMIGYYEMMSFVTIVMVLSWFLKLRQIFAHMEMANNQQAQDDQAANQRFKILMTLKLFVPLIASFFIINNILTQYWLWYVLMLYPLLQIYHNSRFISRRSCFDWRIHLVVFLTQVSYPIGMKFFDDNIFKTPKDRTFCFILFGIVLAQLVFMALQKVLGNLFFLPRSLRNEYSYIRDLGNTPNAGELTCPICMFKLSESPEEEGLTKHLITKFMETPCNHSFHEECLKKWLDVRLICPCCRLSLPPCAE
jgi:hypothetical protein